MKTGSNGGFSRTGLTTKQTATSSPDIDKLAQEIFARLNDMNRNDAVEELEARLTQAANTLVHSRNVAYAVLHAGLQRLPSKQREALLLHLSGLTCAQIAKRQGRTHLAALKDLSGAYTRVRFSLEPIDQVVAPMVDSAELREHEKT